MQQELPSDLVQTNSSFSSELLGMQLFIDSTSLGEAKTCLRKYYLSIIWGYQPKAQRVDLEFGILIHSAREFYDRARASGAEHEDALSSVVKWALLSTWNRVLGRPWITDDPNKNRATLIRSIVWYLDQLGKDDPLKTVLDASGKPLVEISFRFDSGFRTSSLGEQITLCGHGDKVASLNEDHYWVDVKSTKHALDAKYFSQYAPNNQMSLYDIAGTVILQKATKGVIIDALQVGATFTRAKRHFVPKDTAQRSEWLAGFGFYAEMLEKAAVDKHWPMNESSCGLYFGCQFRNVCSRSPSSRETWLRADFTRRVWDPLLRRGDI